MIYDFVILGAGWGGLSLAALLAKEGKNVCLIEKNDRPCGYGYFNVGEYEFSPNAYYLQGCSDGWKFYKFLEEIGVEKEILFNSLDTNGYDRLRIPDISFDMPIGIENASHKLSELFPNEDSKIEKFFEILVGLDNELDFFEGIPSISKVLLHPFSHPYTLRYGWMTLQQVFNHLHISSKLQHALMGTTLVTAYAPSSLSILVAAAEYVGYASCHFPKKGIGHMIKTIETAAKNFGLTTKYNRKVLGISNINKDGARTITTDKGNFQGKYIISNIDPQITYNLLNKKGSKKISYEFTPSIFVLFLGINDISVLKDKGFGNWNYYVSNSDNMDKTIEAMNNGHYDPISLFIGTPSLIADPGSLCDPNKATMQIITTASYTDFASLTPKEQQLKKSELTEKILSFVSKQFDVDITKYIESSEAWSPVDFQEKTGRPHGNIYGKSFTPKNILFKTIPQETPYKNIYLVGANSSLPGLLGVVNGSLTLRDKLLKR